MGATPSKEEPAAKRDVLRADVDQGFFSSLWLCGGGDAVDDKAIEKVRKHNDRSGDIRTARVNDAARVTESADLFVREFKQTMRERGFAGFKYNRNGRSAPRIFLLDTNEQMARRGAGRATRRPARRRRAPPQVQWKTKKTAKVVNGDKSAPGAVTAARWGGGSARPPAALRTRARRRFDALLLVDIEDVSRGCEARASRLLQGDEAKRVLDPRPTRAGLARPTAGRRELRRIDARSGRCLDGSGAPVGASAERRRRPSNRSGDPRARHRRGHVARPGPHDPLCGAAPRRRLRDGAAVPDVRRRPRAHRRRGEGAAQAEGARGSGPGER